MHNINHWCSNHFYIDDSKIKIKYNNVAIIDILNTVKKDIKGPINLKFPHILSAGIDRVFSCFNQAINKFDYTKSFNPIFPLKANQFSNFVSEFKELSKKYNYGLEAGSKAELIIAMNYNNENCPIIVNGFKDEEFIRLCFLSFQMNKMTTIIIENLQEIKNIVKLAKEMPENIPFIGIRVKLHTLGIGIWKESSGIDSKFGLTSIELLEAISLLKKENLIGAFKMLHFHIGSQIEDIKPLNKAIKEMGNIYAQVKKMGSNALDAVNIGGGMAVEYSHNPKKISVNYSTGEFANNVVFLLKDSINNKNIEEPHIYIESGRFISAYHSVLLVPVLEIYSQTYNIDKLIIKEKNPPLLDELNFIYKNISKKNAKEFLHDSIMHMENLLTLFDLGYIDLIDKANTEILVNLILSKCAKLLKNIPEEEKEDLQNMVKDRYLLNFSLFNSLPDYWGIKQKFPILPLENLNDDLRSASIVDITCDSDGEIKFNKDFPIYLHEIDLSKEDYFVGIFLTGAYQEILAMKHNLFDKPTDIIVKCERSGFSIKKTTPANSINDTLSILGFDIKEIEKRYLEVFDKKNYDFLSLILKSNNYLKTIGA
jgi:arginine decarboxylase